MRTVITLAQIVTAVMLMSAILLQAKGSGLGSAWGGSGETYRSKRGVEKILFFATIALAICFLLASIANVLA